jgi:hypothetical protein
MIIGPDQSMVCPLVHPQSINRSPFSASVFFSVAHSSAYIHHCCCLNLRRNLIVTSSLPIMRSAVTVATAMLAHYSVIGVPTAAIAAAPARSIYTHMRSVSGFPTQSAFASRSVTGMAGVPAVCSVPRRSMSDEPKIKRVRQEWEDDEPEKVFDERGRQLFGDKAAKYLAEQAEKKEKGRIEFERTRTTMTEFEDKQKGTRGTTTINQSLGNQNRIRPHHFLATAANICLWFVYHSLYTFSNGFVHFCSSCIYLYVISLNRSRGDIEGID